MPRPPWCMLPGAACNPLLMPLKPIQPTSPAAESHEYIWSNHNTCIIQICSHSWVTILLVIYPIKSFKNKSNFMLVPAWHQLWPWARHAFVAWQDTKMSLHWGTNRKFLYSFYMRWDRSHVNLSLFCTGVRHLLVMKSVSVFFSPKGKHHFVSHSFFSWFQNTRAFTALWQQKNSACSSTFRIPANNSEKGCVRPWNGIAI